MTSYSSYFSSSQLANSGEDYSFTSGMLEFVEGELIKSFSLSISDDSLPETDEYVFIAITSVELDVNSVTSVDTSGMSIAHHQLRILYTLAQYIDI